MQNVKLTSGGKKLTIEIDLTVKGEPSKTGKSLVLASTLGNVDVPNGGGAKIGLNIYKPHS